MPVAVVVVIGICVMCTLIQVLDQHDKEVRQRIDQHDKELRLNSKKLRV